MTRPMALISLLLLAVFSLQAQSEALIKSERQSYIHRHQVKQKAGGDAYDLIFQHLHLKIDPDTHFIEGMVYSEFEVLEDNFNELEFDLDDRMTVDSIRSSGTALNYNHSNDVISIIWPSSALGSKHQVEVYYHGDPTVNEQRGFSYDLHQTGPICWTLSEPYGAYGWWPCKQQLADKIDSFEMSVEVPFGNKAAGLGLLTAVDTLDEGLLFHWEHNYALATYLVAVAVTNYEEFTHYAHFPNGDSLAILEYIYPEFMFIADTQALKVEEMLVLFDSLFGPYPFMEEKYGHAMWGRGGGMEHQTMSFMSDLDFSLMAHELAHQWYGDKITCGSWQDIWLNEGFASYLTALAYEYLRPQAEWEEYMRYTLERALSQNDGSVFVYDTTSVGRIFSGPLSYSKAAMVLQMLRWELGDDIFYQAIRNYTASTELCYDFARTADLQWYLEQESGTDLAQISLIVGSIKKDSRSYR